MAWRKDIILHKPKGFMLKPPTDRLFPVLLYKRAEVIGIDDLNPRAVRIDSLLSG